VDGHLIPLESAVEKTLWKAYQSTAANNPFHAPFRAAFEADGGRLGEGRAIDSMPESFREDREERLPGRCVQVNDPVDDSGIALYQYAVPKVTIDGKELEVPAGINLIEAAKLAGAAVPIIAITRNSPSPATAASAWWRSKSSPSFRSPATRR
jgi:hypothetical protein